MDFLDPDMDPDSPLHRDAFSRLLPPRSWSRHSALNEELAFNERRFLGPTPWETSDEYDQQDVAQNGPATSVAPYEPTPAGWTPGDWNQYRDDPDTEEATMDNDRDQIPENWADAIPPPQNYNATYQSRPSSPLPNRRPAPTDEASQRWFLESYPEGNATLTYLNDRHEVESIYKVNLDIIAEKSLILAMAFEDSRAGPQLFLETLTSATALPFLRYLYTGTYALRGPDGETYEDVPTSLLFHFQLYRLGEIYEAEDLKTEAYVNVFRQCEYGCSSPDKPIDLCAAIRYFYTYLTKTDKLINTVIDYCVTCFLRHHLGDDQEFKQLAYELYPFHQALCTNSRERDFENETAGAIIRLPFKSYAPETYASREDAPAQRFDDFIFHFHANDELDDTSKKRKRIEPAVSKPKQWQGSAAFRKLSDGKQGPAWKPLADTASRATESKASASGAAGMAASPSGEPSLARERDLPLRPHRSLLQTRDGQAESSTAMASLVSNDKYSQAGSDKGSDSEYEMVPGPSKVEDLSDTDSDGSSLVHVRLADAVRNANRSHQNAGNAAGAAQATPDVFDGDSEWELM